MIGLDHAGDLVCIVRRQAYCSGETFRGSIYPVRSCTSISMPMATVLVSRLSVLRESAVLTNSDAPRMNATLPIYKTLLSRRAPEIGPTIRISASRPGGLPRRWHYTGYVKVIKMIT